MIKAYKYRIYPTEAQKDLLSKTFGSVRFVYNYYLNKRTVEYETNKVKYTYKMCSSDLTELKKSHKWLNDPDSKALQNTIKDLDVAFKRFFNGEANYPTFKTKRRSKKSYRTSQAVAISDDSIKLPKLGVIKAKIHRQYSGRILNVTISQTQSDKYYASFTCENIDTPTPPITDKAVGLDLGIKDFCVTSDGVKHTNHKYLIQSERKLAKLQRSLARKQRASKNRAKASLKVARMYEKISNQRKDFLHKLSHELVRDNAIICVEDLNVSGMIKNKNLAKHITDVSWSTFIEYLSYKSKLYSRQLIKIDRFYPSSQTCSECGNVDKNVKNLSVRAWTCSSCGADHDRDINGAVNILKEGLRTIHN